MPHWTRQRLTNRRVGASGQALLPPRVAPARGMQLFVLMVASSPRSNARAMSVFSMRRPPRVFHDAASRRHWSGGTGIFMMSEKNRLSGATPPPRARCSQTRRCLPVPGCALHERRDLLLREPHALHEDVRSVVVRLLRVWQVATVPGAGLARRSTPPRKRETVPGVLSSIAVSGILPHVRPRECCSVLVHNGVEQVHDRLEPGVLGPGEVDASVGSSVRKRAGVVERSLTRPPKMFALAPRRWECAPQYWPRADSSHRGTLRAQPRDHHDDPEERRPPRPRRPLFATAAATISNWCCVPACARVRVLQCCGVGCCGVRVRVLRCCGVAVCGGGGGCGWCGCVGGVGGVCVCVCVCVCVLRVGVVGVSLSGSFPAPLVLCTTTPSWTGQRRDANREDGTLVRPARPLRRGSGEAPSLPGPVSWPLCTQTADFGVPGGASVGLQTGQKRGPTWNCPWPRAGERTNCPRKGSTPSYDMYGGEHRCVNLNR